jgi:hypothetical protein
VHQPVFAEGQLLQRAGLYRWFDTTNRFLDLCDIPDDSGAGGGYRLSCQRYPLSQELPVVAPAFARVEGEWRNGRIQVKDWQAAAPPVDGMTRACEAFFQARSSVLAGLDWGDIARPGYAETSARFSLLPGELSRVGAQVQAYDPDKGWAVVRFPGPELPEQHPLVHRLAVVYCIVEAGSPYGALYAVATIEGWVEE